MIALKHYLKNPGIRFIILFTLLFGLFYGFNLFFIGLTSPEGLTYSAFAAKHLNYIDWLRASILETSKWMLSWFNIEAYRIPPFRLKLQNGAAVSMVYKCIGYGIMSFWAAFIIAHDLPWRKKFIWTIGGLVAIWFINCWRVVVLLMALKYKWNYNKYMDHHTMFNIVAYILIFILILWFTRKEQQRQLI